MLEMVYSMETNRTVKCLVFRSIGLENKQTEGSKVHHQPEARLVHSYIDSERTAVCHRGHSMKRLRDKEKVKLKGGGKLNMKALDADEDGKVVLAEFMAAGGTAEQFRALDINGSGYLDEAELGAVRCDMCTRVGITRNGWYCEQCLDDRYRNGQMLLKMQCKINNKAAREKAEADAATLDELEADLISGAAAEKPAVEEPAVVQAKISEEELAAWEAESQSTASQQPVNLCDQCAITQEAASKVKFITLQIDEVPEAVKCQAASATQAQLNQQSHTALMNLLQRNQVYDLCALLDSSMHLHGLDIGGCLSES